MADAAARLHVRLLAHMMSRPAHLLYTAGTSTLSRRYPFGMCKAARLLRRTA